MSLLRSTQPFQSGPPRFDVGLKPIPLNQWLFPDDQADWLSEKSHLLDTRLQEVFAEDLSSRAAQIELAQLMGIKSNSAPEWRQAPLVAASHLVSDDLVLLANTQGEWRVQACCLCSPTFFSARHAMGKTLSELHAPVPDDGFGLSARIGRVFTHLTIDQVLERHNWTVQWSDARHTPDGAPLRELAARAPVTGQGEHLFLRVERQTIRKLPKTRSLIFTIRIRLTPLAELLGNIAMLHAFAAAWRDAPESVRHYKKWRVLEPHVAAFLNTFGSLNDVDPISP